MPPASQLTNIPLAGGGGEDPPPKEPETRKDLQNWWDSLISSSGANGIIPVDQQGVCIGEALPPVPERLVSRIQKWEFIDMAELLPEALVSARTVNQSTAALVHRKRPVTDILTWVQCFGVYVGILAKQFPDSVPELMSYMITIIKASRNYEGLAWVNYDTLYRRRAAATNCRSWSQINPSLFPLCFTGKGQNSQQCDLCGDTSHRAEDCTIVAESEPDLASRLRTLESRLLTMNQGPGTFQKRANPARRRSEEVCNRYNEQQCRFYYCRYRHVCSACGGNHPVVLCRQGKYPNTHSPQLERQRPY